MSAAVHWASHAPVSTLKWGERPFKVSSGSSRCAALLVPSLGGIGLARGGLPAAACAAALAAALKSIRSRPTRLHGRADVVSRQCGSWRCRRLGPVVVGASVGLKAGYTQLASGLSAPFLRPRLSSASRRSGASWVRLRRRSRVIAAGRVSGPPLAGAFYAFELCDSGGIYAGQPEPRFGRSPPG